MEINICSAIENHIKEFLYAKFKLHEKMFGQELNFKIDGKPLILKNRKQIIINPKTKKPLIISNKDHEDHIEGVIQSLQIQRMKYSNIVFPIKQFFISYEFHYNDRRMGDVTNLFEAPNDAMKKAGIIEDDKFLITPLPSCRVLNKEWAGTIIKMFVPNGINHIVE